MDTPSNDTPYSQTPPDEKAFLRKLARALGRVPFAEDLLAAYYCALDPQTPTRVRGMIFGAVAYFILPFDLVPDMILGLGFTDDASVIAAVIAMLSTHLRPDDRARARTKLDEFGSA